MDLSKIKGTINYDLPTRTTVYGEQKRGKSTFGSQAPGAIFIQTEDGLSNIDAKAFPLANKWQDVLDAVATLYNDPHDYRTAVLDSADWAEKLVHAEVARLHNVKSIESIGYGKGFIEAADMFKELLDGFNALRTQRNMNVVILCHCQIRRFDDPLAESYDRYEIKMQKQVAKLIQEWSDVIGFANMEMVTKTQKEKGFNEERKIAIATGRTILYLQKSPAFDAGNRFSLPASIPLDWPSYEAALAASRKVK